MNGEPEDSVSKTETFQIVIPVYNEVECIDELLSRLLSFRESFREVDISILFVDDGSTDGGLDKLLAATKKYPFVALIELSRNFGHQIALSAGLDHADADYIGMIDADLQDPPELFRDMVELCRQGFDTIYAKRKFRAGESRFKIITARIFYNLIGRICKIYIPENTGDYRVITRRVNKEFVKMRELHRFVRGMIPWIGFKSTFIEYDRKARHAGQTKYSLRKMVQFAIDAILSFSMAPLRMATLLGFGLIGISSLVGLIILFLWLFTSYHAPGIMAVILMISMMGGLQIVIMGIMAEYIGRLFEQSKDRPLYVVKERVNLPQGTP
ncbi:MAG: glycosyltransferase family 2 protein [Planctomycetes bacterium]|nr:glycosyltransferase family 2 protein [Planctomycetota bacterium]